MQDLWQNLLLLKDSLTGVKERSTQTHTLLFDSCHAAENIAFMLGGEWDNCNGITLTSVDKIAVDTSAKMVGSQWCYQGKSCAVLPRLSVDVLKQRYASGERYFLNANLTGADLSHLNLSEINLGWARLQGANLSGANLQGADLTKADLTDANLAETDMSGAILTGAIMPSARLSNE